MTSSQFYVPHLEPDAREAVLEGAEHRHLAKSARVGPGEDVWLFDDSGCRWLARVATVGRDRTLLRIVRKEVDVRTGPAIVLVQALLNARKMEFVLQKAEELGCAGFVAVTTSRSLKPSGDWAGKKLERWARIAREAAKQSRSASVLAVRPPLPLAGFLRDPGEGLRLFLSEHGGRPLKDVLVSFGGGERPVPGGVVLVVGPEGGWTSGEERALGEAKFEAVGLGRRILRAETAAVAAAAAISLFWGA